MAMLCKSLLLLLQLCLFVFIATHCKPSFIYLWLSTCGVEAAAPGEWGGLPGHWDGLLAAG